MATITPGASSARVNIAAFHGLNQYGDGVNTDASCAWEAVNALTPQGVLQPMPKCLLLAPTLPAPIETLARLYRRWHEDAHEVLIAASGGHLYWMAPESERWTRLPMPFGWVQTAYQSSVWSWAAYEINPDGAQNPVDVLLMSNAQDGMICIRGDTMEVSPVATPKKFGVIARHAERIWGGGIPDDPDMLVYSAPYDPFNWSQNDEFPENGAGDILQPSWDGDSFTALTPFGSQLIAMKRTRVWRVLGLNPGEYIFKEQYGGGAPYAATVAVDGSRILMLGPDGLRHYNGESVSPWQQEWVCRLYARMNPAALNQAAACMYKGVYYCALPLDGSEINNAVLLYNTVENTFLLREGLCVETFLPTEDALYFTSAHTPGQIWLWQEKSTLAEPMRWVSAWQTLGRAEVLKGGFHVYLTAQCDAQTQLTVGIETEKRIRWKNVLLKPGASKQKHLFFSGTGRRFRFLLKSDGTVPWQLTGGLQLTVETDPDEEV